METEPIAKPKRPRESTKRHDTIKAKCRRKILEAATANSITNKTYTAKNINEAVKVCRANGLVDADVLQGAGFNSKGRRG